MQYLVDEFFRAYNSRDSAALLALFQFEASPAFSYQDAPSGRRAEVMVRREEIAEYLRRRWALGDRFSDIQVAPPDQDVAHYPDANPGGDFTRHVSGGVERGSLKMVCAEGRLIGVVMQSAP